MSFLKMNILIYFENKINRTHGGTERAAENLAQALTLQGHKIYYLYKYESDFETSFSSYRLPSHDECAVENANYVETIVKTLGIDVIINEGGNTSDVQMLNHENVRVSCKIITCLHFCPFQGFDSVWQDVRVTCFHDLLSLLKAPINRFRAIQRFKDNYLTAIRHTDAFVVLSASFVEDVIQIVGDESVKTKIKVIPNINSYSIQNLSLEKKENRLLYIGRLQYQTKRVDRLLKAWSLNNLDNNCVLDILGDGPDREYYEKISKRLGLKNVVFHGFQDPLEFYKKAKIIALTSTHESFGMTLIEGMANGCVPIVFNSYATASEIVTNGVDGVTIKPYDIQEFSRQIALIMKDNDVFMKLAKNARKNVVRYDESAIMPQWNSLYSALDLI